MKLKMTLCSRPIATVVCRYVKDFVKWISSTWKKKKQHQKKTNIKKEVELEKI